MPMVPKPPRHEFQHTTLTKPPVPSAPKPNPYVLKQAFGKNTISEQTSLIQSRIGRSNIEPLEARMAFMKGVLPKCKASRHMIPIAEHQ